MAASEDSSGDWSMKLPGLNGYPYRLNIEQYRIDWDREVSGPQKFVKDFFFPYWNKDVVLEELRIPGSLLRIDILNLTKRIAVEVSPEQHRKFNKHFHKNIAGLINSYKRDEDKEKWCGKVGFKYVELTEEDLPELSYQWFKDTHDISL